MQDAAGDSRTLSTSIRAKGSWHAVQSLLVHAGRGRQVIAVCKSADLLLMVLDASKPHAHRKILTAELEAVGIRLNRCPQERAACAPATSSRLCDTS